MRNETYCNINKTQALLQTTGGKDEQNIALMRTTQHRTKNVKTYNRTKRWTPGADPGFQVRGAHLKKIAPSGGRRENF